MIIHSHLKKIIHDNCSISYVCLNKIQECRTVQTKQLSQSLGTNCKQLRSVTKHPNFAKNISSLCFINYL